MEAQILPGDEQGDKTYSGGAAPLADPGKRIVAYLIDCGVVIAIGIVAGIAQTVLQNVPIVGGILSMATGGITLAYTLLKDGLYGGRSVGKKVMELQVITESGQGATMLDSVKRNILFVVPLMIVVELVMLLTNEENKRLGDQIASTRVVVSPDSHAWGDFMGS